jgi:murein DD-endopeptidase MepM/ murein hydrolase activator NlpD
VLQAFHFAPRDDLDDFYDETGRAVHGGWLRTPLRYDHISSPFDPRRMHPVLRRVMPHNGVDYSAPTGTPVWAAADGTVTFVGERGPNGNLVSISHQDGYESFYAHLSRFASGLAVGQQVTQRQVIGYVGNTGRSTGPHLHFGLKRRGRFVDPARELNGPGRMLPSSFIGRFRQEVARQRARLAAIALPDPTPAARSAPEPTASQPTPERGEFMD